MKIENQYFFVYLFLASSLIYIVLPMLVFYKTLSLSMPYLKTPLFFVSVLSLVSIYSSINHTNRSKLSTIVANNLLTSLPYVFLKIILFSRPYLTGLLCNPRYIAKRPLHTGLLYNPRCIAKRPLHTGLLYNPSEIGKRA